MKTREREYSETLDILFKDIYEGKSANTTTFQITEQCSLRCIYCYETNKTPSVMTLDQAKKFIDILFNQKKDITFAHVIEFIGGEPLLEPELISNIIDYWEYQCIMHYPEVPWGLYTIYSICTNGTTWKNEKVQKLFNKIKNRLSFTVSIDGNKELHDSARIYPDGSGSYDDAIFAANDYEQKTNSILGSKMTIAPSNLKFVYPALKYYMDSGRDLIHANCVYEEGWTVEHAKELYKQLKKVADYKLDNYPEIYLSLFDEEWYSPTSKEETNRWCGAFTGKMISVAPNGFIYPCIRFAPTSIKNSDFNIGNLQDGIDMSFIKKCDELDRKSYMDDKCFNCPISKGCGSCEGYAYERFHSINHKLTFHCQMHQAQALANVYYWNKYYRLNNIQKRFKNYMPEEWSLNIIDKKELKLLNDLTLE